VSHRTSYASAQLVQVFGDRFFLKNSGATITLPRCEKRRPQAYN